MHQHTAQKNLLKRRVSYGFYARLHAFALWQAFSRFHLWRSLLRCALLYLFPSDSPYLIRSRATRRAFSAATHFLRSLLCGGFICSAGRPLLDEARGAYEKTLELEPENQPARNSLQSLLKLAHDPDPIWVSLTNVHRFKLPAAS